jgi:hypothetical protein
MHSLPPQRAPFKVDPGSGNGLMTVSIVDGIDTTNLTIDAKSAASLAAAILAGAKKSFELSGKPPPPATKDNPISPDGAVACSGMSLAPDRAIQSALHLIFHFGETALAIRVPREAAQTFGQQLLTVAAPTALSHPH